MDWSALAAFAVPAVGWGISVERRLAKIDLVKLSVESVQDKVDSSDAKLDKLVEHLITRGRPQER